MRTGWQVCKLQATISYIFFKALHIKLVMFRTNCIMQFLRCSSVCVLPRIFFRCARIKLLYIDINDIASYRIAYKEYIDISYKLDIQGVVIMCV